MTSEQEDAPFKVLIQPTNPLENRNFYSDRRHVQVVCNYRKKGDQLISDWRMKERMKTVSVALVLCLNIGIDPPDVVKTNPCAKLEAWVDPFAFPPQKALETIGRQLQSQYEVWQPRAKYKTSLDPCVEELKKLCLSLRKSSKEERVLFHYNGHGVPKPTPGGELWVFNKNYTQYIPVPISDLQTWLGSPCIYVYDCSAAGNMLTAFDKFAEQRDNAAEAYRRKQMEDPAHAGEPIANYRPLRDCIQLAACKSNETLPMTPDLPADLFSACLTTPLDIGLRWFFSQNPLLRNITVDMISKVPGKHNDRRTPLGELNWIFTAITDTIAWNVLPNDLFKKLFRQDLMVAALFRNYLLAERVMRHYHCTPQSYPALPSTHQHPMWKAWDLVVDSVLSQLPNLLNTGTMNGQLPVTDYVHSSFFAEQLTAFEVWLAKGPISEEIPEQLPIVLQVLLSQVHRVRALMLLSRFLDIGPWAVNLALSVGIFPYVLKLLQSPAVDLRPVLVFIWAKILAVDRSCQADLFKDNGYTYFINILASTVSMPNVPNLSEHRAMCAFILWVFCHNFPAGQQACLQKDLMPALLQHINDPDPLLRQWVCSCLAEFWMDNNEVKKEAYRHRAHMRLYELLNDESPEVRTAALGAIGSFIGHVDGTTQDEHNELYHRLSAEIIITGFDASPMVRKELILSLASLIEMGNPRFLNAIAEILEEERKSASNQVFMSTQKRAQLEKQQLEQLETSIASLTSNLENTTFYEPTRAAPTVYTCIWRTLLILSVDPFESIANIAGAVVDTILAQLAAANLISLPPKTIYPASDRDGKHERAGSSIVHASHMENVNRNSNSFTVHAGTLNPLKRLSSIGLNKLGKMTEGEPSGVNDAIAQDLKAVQSLNLRRISSMQTMGANDGRPLSASGADSIFKNDIANPADNAKIGIKIIAPQPGQNFSISFQDTPAVKRAKHSFFDWNCAYFAEPQMRLTEIDDPGSYLYNERHWRRQRNKDIFEDLSHYGPLIEADDNLNVHMTHVLHCNFKPELAVFHQFEPQIAIADSHQTVCAFNLEENKRVGQVMNGNPLGSKITSMRFLNEHDLSLLLVGSDDGVVRLYREYGYQARPLTAWRALPDFQPYLNTGLLGGLPANWSAKLLTEWNQNTGHLAASGGDLSIRIWAADSEICIQDIPTRSKHAMTTLSFGSSTSLLYAGFSNGSMSVYDRRVRSSQGHVAMLDPIKFGNKSGQSYITSLRSYDNYNYSALRLRPPPDALGGIETQPLYSFPHIVSMNSMGEVNVWDLRTTMANQALSENGAGQNSRGNGSLASSTSSLASMSHSGLNGMAGQAQYAIVDGCKVFQPNRNFVTSMDIEANKIKAIIRARGGFKTREEFEKSFNSFSSASYNDTIVNGCLHENLPVVAGVGNSGSIDIFSVRPTDLSSTAIYNKTDDKQEGSKLKGRKSQKSFQELQDAIYVDERDRYKMHRLAELQTSESTTNEHTILNSFSINRVDSDTNDSHRDNRMSNNNSRKNSAGADALHSRPSSSTSLSAAKSFASLAQGFVSAIKGNSSSSNAQQGHNGNNDGYLSMSSSMYKAGNTKETCNSITFHKQKLDMAIVGDKKVTVYSLY